MAAKRLGRRHAIWCDETECGFSQLKTYIALIFEHLGLYRDPVHALLGKLYKQIQGGMLW
jgi:hypothetical protein